MTIDNQHIIIFIIPVIAYLWVYSLPFLSFIKRFWFTFRNIPLKEQINKRLKPLDCEVCLSFWATLIYLSCNDLLTQWYLVPVNMYLSVILARKT